GLIFGYGVSNFLQQDSLTCSRGCNYETPLPLSYRAKEVDHPRGNIARLRFHVEPLVGIQRCEVVEGNSALSYGGMVVVYGFNSEHCKEALTLFRRTNLAIHCVASFEVEESNLAWRKVNVVGT